jgi:tetratricopeptide (TPR) repeat protein
MAGRPPSLALRQLWEAGERAAAIRGALEHWDGLLASGEDVQWLERALRISGLAIESTAVQAYLARSGNDARAWEDLVGSVLGTGDPWWARELLTECGLQTRELDRLRVECDLALGDDAAQSIAAFQRAHSDPDALDTVVGWWIANRQVEEAERLLTRQDQPTPWRAKLALWRGDTKTACALARALPATPETACIEGAAALLDGNLDAAESRLRRVLDDNASAEAWSWLATTLRKRGRFDEAVRAADSANLTATDLTLAPRIERELAIEYGREAAGTSRRGAFAWLRRRLGLSRERLIRDLEYAAMLYPLGLRPHDPLPALETAIARLGGNRTSHPTTCVSGALKSLRLPVDPRQLGAVIQSVLWTRGAAAVRALYRHYAPTVDHHPLFLIYQGEIELWMGAYEDAEKIFRAAIDRDGSTKWAWIGLGASLMLQGDLAAAQTTWAEGLEFSGGFAGPTLYVYRGECHRRQGERSEARADLEYAIAEKPQRLSAHVNLALLDGDPESLQRAESACRSFAPLLMEDLTGTTAEKLEQVLLAMRGNRSSSPWHMTYHLWGRLWRRAT